MRAIITVKSACSALLLVGLQIAGSPAHAQINGSLEVSGTYQNQAVTNDRGSWSSTMTIRNSEVSGTIYTGSNYGGSDTSLAGTTGVGQWKISSGSLTQDAGSSSYNMSLSLTELLDAASPDRPRTVTVNLVWTGIAGGENTYKATGKAVLMSSTGGSVSYYDCPATGLFKADATVH